MKNTDSEPTIILLGNSFANQLYPGFATNPKFGHQSILSIGACDASGYVPSGFVIARSNPCFGERAEHQRDFIDDIIKSSQSIKYVVIDGLDLIPEDRYIENLSKRVGLIESYGKTVIIFTPHLRPDFDPKACFSRPSMDPKKDCDFSLDIKKKQLQNFQPLIASFSKTNPKALFFDQNDLYCDNKKCSYIKDGMPLHRDSSHLSEYGSKRLSELFVSWASINIPSIINPE